MTSNETYIREAIKVAQKAKSIYGVVVVKSDEIISSGTNRTEADNDPTAHAEIVAIRNASKELHSRYLEGCSLYTTAEPCPMCTSAAIWAKMDKLVFGANLNDLVNHYGKRQTAVSAKDIVSKGDPKIELVEECLRDECLTLLRS